MTEKDSKCTFFEDTGVYNIFVVCAVFIALAQPMIRYNGTSKESHHT